MGAYINAGIKEVYFSAGAIQLPCNAAATTPTYTDVWGMGIRQAGNMVGNHFNEFRDHKNRAFPNLFNYKIEMPTMQIKDDSIVMALFDSLIAGKAAVGVVTSGVSHVSTEVVSPNGGIFIFEDSYAMGVDFEIVLGLTERKCTVTFEGAYKYGASSGEHEWFLAQAATNELLWATEKLPDIVVAAVVDQFISPTFIPTSISGLTPNPMIDANIVDFTCTFRSKSSKNGFNFSLPTGIEVELMIKVAGPDAAAMIEIVDYEMETTASITIGFGTLDIIMTKNGLTRIGDLEISDEKREAGFIYSGEYDLEYVDMDTPTEITMSTYLA